MTNALQSDTADISDIAAIEESLVAQWSIYGQAPGGVFHEDGDLVWSEAPVPHLPYNAVLRTQLGNNAAERIAQVIAHFRQRGVEFLWIVHPTARPADLSDRLAAHGMLRVENATGMSLDLRKVKALSAAASGPVVYREVTDEESLKIYGGLVDEYWELSEKGHAYVVGMSRWSYGQGNHGTRWIATMDGKPVGKVYLSLRGFADTAAIFGVYVTPAGRGYGIATALTRLAIQRAAALGRKRVFSSHPRWRLGSIAGWDSPSGVFCPYTRLRRCMACSRCRGRSWCTRKRAGVTVG